MKVAIFVSSIVALLAFSEAHGQPKDETISGFQCVGINISGLQISQDDLRTGAKFPMILGSAKGRRKSSEADLYNNLHCMAPSCPKWIC